MGVSMKRCRPENSTIASSLASTSFFFIPMMEPFRKMFSRPVSSSWNPAPTSSSAPTRAYPAGGGISDFREYLEERALAGTVTADDADDLALLHGEGDIAQGPQ